MKTALCVYTPRDTDVQEKKFTRTYRKKPWHGRTGKKASTAVPERKKSWHGRVYKKNADTAVTQLYSNKYLIAFKSSTFKRPVMFHKMNFKNGIKDLKSYTQTSRRVRDTLARLFTSGWCCCCALERVVLSSTAVHTLCTLFELCTAARAFLNGQNSSFVYILLVEYF